MSFSLLCVRPQSLFKILVIHDNLHIQLDSTESRSTLMARCTRFGVRKFSECDLFDFALVIALDVNLLQMQIYYWGARGSVVG
jgi:hypothetical protein